MAGPIAGAGAGGADGDRSQRRGLPGWRRADPWSAAALALPVAMASAAACAAAALPSGAEGPPPTRDSPAPLSLLPCPLAAGWELVAQTTLPRRHGVDRASGGFSAARYHPSSDLLELLSDRPRGGISRWSGLAALARRGATLPPPGLRGAGDLPLLAAVGAPLPMPLDGEGLAWWRGRLWVVSEEQRSAGRPGLLLRFSPEGILERALPLPPDWRPGPGSGLEANRGPESLAVLRRPDGGEGLLMAAERPLLQDPPDRVRLLEWRPAPLPAGEAAGEGMGLEPRPLQPLALPGRDDWGLTELLPVGDRRGATGLLALLRRYEPPDGWSVRLALYPTPAAEAAATGPAGGPGPLAPLKIWSPRSGLAVAEGERGGALPQDNWEGLATGPTLADGRPSLLLVSDDNLNPLQENRLVLLAPRRGPACRRPGP